MYLYKAKACKPQFTMLHLYSFHKFSWNAAVYGMTENPEVTLIKH